MRRAMFYAPALCVPQAAHSQQGGVQYTDPEAVRAVPAHHPIKM